MKPKKSNAEKVTSEIRLSLLDIMKTFNLKLVSPLDVTREQGASRTCRDHIFSDLPLDKSVSYAVPFRTNTMDGLKSERLYM